MRRLRILAIYGVLLSAQAFACQETMIEYRLSDRVIFADGQGKPLSGASVVVRKAFGPSTQHTGWGRPIGEVILRGRTDRNGKFSLKGLQGTSYWVTYNDQEKGESFLLVRGETQRFVELRLDSYVAHNVCYVVDIEHNTTKPPGWSRPIITENP